MLTNSLSYAKAKLLKATSTIVVFSYNSVHASLLPRVTTEFSPHNLLLAFKND